MAGDFWTVNFVAFFLLIKDISRHVYDLDHFGALAGELEELVVKPALSDGCEAGFIVQVEHPGRLIQLFGGGLLSELENGGFYTAIVEEQPGGKSSWTSTNNGDSWFR